MQKATRVDWADPVPGAGDGHDIPAEVGRAAAGSVVAELLRRGTQRLLEQTGAQYEEIRGGWHLVTRCTVWSWLTKSSRC